jgi:hypothetical protein
MILCRVLTQPTDAAMTGCVLGSRERQLWFGLLLL